MTNEQKKQVRDALVRYAGNFDTQTRAAESLEGISASTISLVRNNNWELLSERMWHHVARQVGFYCGESSVWRQADTSAYLLLRILFSDAQHYAMTYGIAIAEGLGKTFTAGCYMRENEHCFYVAGNADYNRREFIVALLNMAGIEKRGTMPEMMQLFAKHLNELDEALVIVDDADKLKDRVLHLLLLLSDSVAGQSGIVIMGGDKLRTRIAEGVRQKKAGFEEIFQHIGRRFITLGGPGPKDVELVCRANGVGDEAAIAYIRENCNDSLHVAVQLIRQYEEMNAAA